MRSAALLALFATAASAAEIENTVIAENLRDPMEITVTPDGGDIFVVERAGRVLRVHPATGGVFEMGNIPVTALQAKDPDSPYAREDGVLGITLDPAFPINRHLYIYYSHATKMLNRLSRFTLKDGKLDMASELPMLDVETDRADRVCHHGGSLTFGPDGLLYLSCGDNTNPFESDGYSPLDRRPGRDRMDSERGSGNTNNLRGKILRIRPTEAGYDIPVGNLFPPGTAKTRPEIYVMGCRNPFRISVDPKTKALYWGEVGPDASNDGPKGPRGYDEINQALRPGNFGWPFVIANNQPYPIVDFATGQPTRMTNPASPLNDSPNNTGLNKLPPAQPALIWYPYGESKEFPVLGSGGRCAMAGPVFYFDSSRKFNLLDRGDDHTLLVYEWARGKIFKARLGAGEKLTGLTQMMEGLVHPMDMEMAKDGSVYLAEYGSNWWFNTDGRLRRLRAANGNHAPTLSAITPGAQPGQYSVSDVADADGDKVTVEWWLTNGASETKVGTGESVTLAGNGSELRAVATDAKGAVSVKRLPLVVAEGLPPLAMKLDEETAVPGGDVHFKITGDPTPETKTLVIRARYIPPTGHDAGGPMLDAALTPIVTSRGCFACHQVGTKSVGPAYLDVAMKYRDDPNAVATLLAKIKAGGAGVWGEVMMPPQVAVSEEEGTRIIHGILGLADGISEAKGIAEGTLKLPPAPANAGPNGAWEISAEGPGRAPAKTRLKAN
jgi:cytochrome c